MLDRCHCLHSWTRLAARMHQTFKYTTRGQPGRLGDFGISKLCLEKNLPTAVSSLGHKGYRALEVEEGSIPGQPADIFSLGAVFLEMLIAYTFPKRRR